MLAHMNGQDSKKKVASKVKNIYIYLISPLDFTVLADLVFSDTIGLENSKNVAYRLPKSFQPVHGLYAF